MSTYEEIQNWVRQNYGWEPKTCWIAHVKEINGIPVKKAHNRQGEREEPCPEKKRTAIEAAFKYYGMMD